MASSVLHSYLSARCSKFLLCLLSTLKVTHTVATTASLPSCPDGWHQFGNYGDDVPGWGLANSENKASSIEDCAAQWTSVASAGSIEYRPDTQECAANTWRNSIASKQTGKWGDAITCRKSLVAYWDHGNCGPYGNDKSWTWCDTSEFNCAQTVQTSECKSGVATLADTYGDGTCCASVQIDGCSYAYFAQYQCKVEKYGHVNMEADGLSHIAMPNGVLEQREASIGSLGGCEGCIIVGYGTSNKGNRVTEWASTRSAGREFGTYPYRNEPQNFVIYAVEEAEVSLTKGKEMSVQNKFSLKKGQFRKVSANFVNTLVEIKSSGDILVSMESTDADYVNLVPAAQIIYGTCSTICRIVVFGATKEDIIQECSDGSSKTWTGNFVYTVPSSGDQYTGTACKWTAPSGVRISGHSWADSDGWDGTSFLAAVLFQRVTPIPLDMEFVKLISDQQATCSNGKAFYTLQGNKGVYTNRLGATKKGTVIKCNKPVQVLGDEQALDDEFQLIVTDTCQSGAWTLKLQASSYCNIVGVCHGKTATLKISGYTACETFWIKKIPSCTSEDTKCEMYDCQSLDVLMLADSFGAKVNTSTQDSMLTCGNQQFTIVSASFEGPQCSECFRHQEDAPMPLIDGLILDFRGGVGVSSTKWFNQVPGGPDADVGSGVSYISREKAWQFPGKGQVISVPIATNPKRMAAVSYSAWVKPLDYMGTLGWVLTQHPDYAWSRSVTINDHRLGGTGVTPGGYKSGFGSLPLNQWSHVVGVWTTSAKGSCSIYANKNKYMHTCTNGAGDNQSEKFIIGGRAPNDGGHNPKVMMTNVAVFNRSLTDMEVELLYGAGPDVATKAHEAVRNHLMAIDTDGTGHVSLPEFKEVFRQSTSVDDAALEAMFKGFDTNGDKMLNNAEFSAAMAATTTSSIPMTAGATSIQVADTTGMSPGMSLLISDGTNSETGFIVDVIRDRRLSRHGRRLAAGRVTVNTPLVYTYAAGATVSATPMLPLPVPPATSGTTERDDEGSGGPSVVFILSMITTPITLLTAIFWVYRKRLAARRRAAALIAPVAGPPAAVAVAVPVVTPAPAAVGKSEPAKWKGKVQVLNEERTPTNTVSREQIPQYWTSNNEDETGAFDQMVYVNMDAFSSFDELLANTYRPIPTQDRPCPKAAPCPKKPGGCPCVKPGGDPGLPTGFIVRRVIRVEEADMWARYVNKRDAIKAKRGTDVGKPLDPAIFTHAVTSKYGDIFAQADSSINEVYLWHGTHVRFALQIAQNDFNIDLAGSGTGTMYGKGTYLAESCTKADEYARDEKDGYYAGVFALVLCRVCLGKYFYTTARDEGAQAKVLSGEFDSTCGDRVKSVNTYRELVVYDKDQIYPEFVVLYNRAFKKDDQAKMREIARNEIFHMQLPVYWNNCHVDPVKVGFRVHYNVKKHTLALIQRLVKGATSANPPTVVHVRRVEDSGMWTRYVNFRAQVVTRTSKVVPIHELDGDHSSGHVITQALLDSDDLEEQAISVENLDTRANEVLLWHGTSKEAAEAISDEGFQISRSSAKHGKRFGEGAYLAEDLHKSLSYAPAADGIQYVLLCRTVCGDMYYTEAGSENLAHLHARNNQKDSVLANPRKKGPREFIVLQEAQVYPEFILELKS